MTKDEQVNDLLSAYHGVMIGKLSGIPMRFTAEGEIITNW